MSLCLVVAAACTGSGASDILHATMHRTGGLAPSAGSGSTCQAIDDSYTFDATTGEVAWQRCEDQGDTGIFDFTPGHTVLPADTDTQLAKALSALHGTQSGCGGDISDRIVITWTDGTTTLDPAQCAQGEDAVFELLDGLN